MTTAIQKVADLIGTKQIAQACGVRAPSVYKWLERGCLPRTEWTGETDYASKIVEAVAAAGGRISKEALLTRPVAKEPRA